MIKEKIFLEKILTKITWQKYLFYDFYDNRNTQCKKAPGAPDCFIAFLTSERVKQENEGKIILPGFSLLMVKEIVALMHLITS